MKSITNRETKGIIFAGCSFTWGQGLYYYSNLSTLKEPEKWLYNYSLVKRTHIEYMKSVRFPRLVANYFNTFELLHINNGGSHQSIISWWNNCFKSNYDKNHQINLIDYTDISHLVFQCTQWHRNYFEFEYDGKKYDIACAQAYSEPYASIFSKWLIEQNLTLSDWESFHKKNNIDMVKTFLKEIESHNIKTIIFTWPEENVDYIKSDEWLNSRFMTIDYKNKTYNSMEELMWFSDSTSDFPNKDTINYDVNRANKELIINLDYENFKITPSDEHPSLMCHKVIADNLIEYLNTNMKSIEIKETKNKKLVYETKFI